MGSGKKERAEPRIAIMASADVAWSDPSGEARKLTGRLEDTSHSGACIRVPIPLSVGLELSIKWHKEHFSGIARYCRKDGLGYLLGIQRTRTERIIASTNSSGSQTENLKPAVPAKVLDVPPQLNANRVSSESSLTPAQKPVEAGANMPHVLTPAAVEREQDSDGAANGLQSQKEETIRETETHAQKPSKIQERTGMLEKWIHRAATRPQQNSSDGNANSKHEPGENMQEGTTSRKPPNASMNGKGAANLQGDLHSMEDVYRAAGIMSLHLGYSINTVIEMLNSDHMLGMSKEVKRAAILMALETAGIPIEEVVRDAVLRNEAINAYEDGQRRHLEEYEARKIQENAQIQAEIERITEHLVDRIKQNLGEVASAKELFRSWQASKQKEVLQISEAAGLCESQPAPEPPVESVVALQAAGFVTKS